VDLFGQDAREPLDYAEMNWSDERYNVGCGPRLPPGLLTDYGAALRAPAGRLHWAGTETAMIWNGYMEGAVRAGRRAAEEVLAAS
ncbi:MAG: FAD-dependent oxidoreductase, partial [Myxococcota bacterium]